MSHETSLDDLNAGAARAADAIRAQARGAAREDAETVISYWRSSLVGYERAARQVMEYAHALGVRVSEEAAVPASRGGR
jgi:hypothetical protein